MGLREYARHRSVNLYAVQDAIKRGRISDAIVGEGKKRKVNSELADQLWVNNKLKDKGSGSTLDNPGRSNDMANSDQVALLKSRAVKETFAAKMAQIKYEETMGNLCSIDSVKESISEMVGGVRNSLLILPDKLSPLLASETDLDEVHKILTNEITEALNSLSRGEFIIEKEEGK